MAGQIRGRKIAILATSGVEQSELTEPRRAVEEAGAETDLVSPDGGKVRAWKHTDWGDELDVDVTLDRARAEEYDALILPGGVMNPDHLRMNKDAVAFVQAFVSAGKPVAAICHAPWLLAEAGVVRGRRLTSYPSLKTDLRNAGAQWVDQEVVVDDGFVTSRRPDDIPAFNRAIIEEVRKASGGEKKAAA